MSSSRCYNKTKEETCISSVTDVCVPHLVLLLEAVTLSAFHLSDVLQQVGHSDGRVQLTRLIG